MANKKPGSTYVQEIELLHNTIKSMEEGPDRTKKQKQLYRKVAFWEKNKLNKVVYVANNEQTPWPLFEAVGLPVLPMKTKAKSGYLQVGDYICCVFIGDGRSGKPDSYHKYLPLVIERKTCEDLHNTIVPFDGWARFKREIDRFCIDDRFSRMAIITETTLKEFLEYKPKIKINKIGKKVYNRDLPVPPEVKRAKIAKCFVLGAPVLFAGTTHQAMKMYKNLIRQTIIEQYADLLGLKQ